MQPRTYLGETLWKSEEPQGSEMKGQVFGEERIQGGHYGLSTHWNCERDLWS